MFCKNRSRRCCRRFGNHSMLVHVRSCLYKRTSKNKRKQRVFIQHDNTTSPNYQHRLRCEAETLDIYVSVIRLSEGLHLQKINKDLETTSSHDHVISSSEEFNHFNSSSKHAAILTTLKKSKAHQLMLVKERYCRKADTNSVEEIIKVLKDPELFLEEFRLKSKRARDCIHLEEEQKKLTLNGYGFQCITLQDPESQLLCDNFMRSPVSLLKAQIRGAATSSTLFNRLDIPTERSGILSYPMTGDLGVFWEASIMI